MTEAQHWLIVVTAIRPRTHLIGGRACAPNAFLDQIATRGLCGFTNCYWRFADGSTIVQTSIVSADSPAGELRAYPA